MPRVKQTPWVRLALYGLALYVVVMLTLIAVNFRRFVSRGSAPVSAPAATVPATSHPALPEAEHIDAK